MKRVTQFLTFLLISQIVFSQSSNTCVSCNNNTIDTTKYSSAIGSENISTGLNSFASGFHNEATGDYSFAGGEESVASQKWAFAFGERAKAEGFRSFAQGMDVRAMGGNSVVIGRYARTLTGSAMVIGYGVDENHNLDNNIPNSLMIGFSSDIPTLFIEQASGTGTTGKIGIGTTEPTEKLEVNGTFKVNDWSYMTTINLDDSDIQYIDELAGNDGLKFRGKTLQTSTQMILTEDGNLGIGTLEPIAMLQVKNGDIFIEDIDRGIVMKSPDGNCWRGTLDNSGILHFVQVNCDDLLTDSEDHIKRLTKRVNIYPNPAGDKVFISIDQELPGFFLEIVDINGKIIYSEKMVNNESYIDLNSYHSGVYMFILKDEDGKTLESYKVVKK